MASEQPESGDFHLKNLLGVESANNDGGASSLESTHSAESDSFVTQIEVISSSSKVIEIEAPSSIQSQVQANFADAKFKGDQSSSTRLFTHSSGNDNSSSATSTIIPPNNTAFDIQTTLSSTLVELKSGNGESILQQSDTTSTTTSHLSKDTKTSISEVVEGGREDKHEKETEKEPEGDDDKEDDDFDQSYDDDTISSEAVVDDIELILMPETLTDFPPTDLSPQLVRVTELKRPMDYDTDVFEDDDEGRSEQESDFQKFGTDDEEAASERSISSRSNLRRRVLLSSIGGGSGVENEELSSRDNVGQMDARASAGGGGKSSGKVHSGSQTEITALETSSFYNPFELKQHHRRRSVGKSSSTRIAGMGLGSIPGGSGSSGTGGGKRLNWKSELTLLPSKTKIRTTGFPGYDELSTNYQDQYSPRVAKFTSQDTLSSSSQFLKPSTLYRTRNLSRNLNQWESSESTLVLPAAGLPSTSDSARYRQNRMSSSTSSNFKDSYSSFHISSRRQPLTSGGQSVSFRSSLPDLSQPDNKGYRQSFKSMKNHKSSSGYRLTKKSSSDDETSSLIDESERVLRSSIDLLLTDDLPSPGGDFSCRSTGGGGSVSGTAFFGYYSSRRSHSQPLLTDDGENGDPRDATMGIPFLPRKLSDMRCSRWAKVILPNGNVAVVAVKEIDELRDSLTVHTDTGCILCLPFRKIVIAWRKR